MRRDLIAQQGFIRTTTGYCRQSTTPTPTNPVPITTIAGDLTWDSTLGKVVANSQWYQIDGADKTQYLPLILEGDTIEVNYRTMKAKITHRYRAVRPTNGSPNTSASGGFYISRSNLTPAPKYGGKLYCTYCTWLGDGSGTGYSYGTCYNSNANGSTSFWVETSAFSNSSAVASWLSNHSDFIFVYEIATPWTEEIDLTEKLRNHPLMEVGDGVELRTLTFEQGYIDNTGSLVNDPQYITSEFIEGGKPIRITCNDDYKITQVHLYDLENNLVSYKFFDNYSYVRSTYSNGKHYELELPKNYKAKITIISNADSNTGYACATPEGNITPDDNAVSEVRVINTRYFKREYLTNTNYINGYKRAKQLLNCQYTPIITKNYKRGESYPNSLDKGNLKFGIPYSECGDHNKFIGKDVSFRTFISAVNNPLSLFYTETPYSATTYNPQRVSSYGYDTGVDANGMGVDYVGSETDGTLYFGQVCACLIDYVLGIDPNYTAKHYLYKTWMGAINITPETDCSNLHPLDCVIRTGHVVLIADILKDIDGNVKFIQCIESASPYVRTEYYTPDEFLNRFDSSTYTIRRFTRIIPEPEETPFIPINPEDTTIPLQLNNDICTIGGDYATFNTNEAIHLSVNNTSNNWQGVKVYKENTLVATRDFTDTTNCTSHTISELSQTWIDINISDLFGQVENGLYTAVAYNSTTESDPTHFEVIYADIKVLKCSSLVNAIYNNPDKSYYIINGGVNGYPYMTPSSTSDSGYYSAIYIKDAEREIDCVGGEPFDIYGSTTYPDNGDYTRIMVKGEYGYTTIRYKSELSRPNKATWTAGQYFDANGNLVSSSSACYTASFMTVSDSYMFAFVYYNNSTTNLFSRIVEYDSNDNQIGVVRLLGRPTGDNNYHTVFYRPTSSNVAKVKMSTLNGFSTKQFYYI